MRRAGPRIALLLVGAASACRSSSSPARSTAAATTATTATAASSSAPVSALPPPRPSSAASGSGGASTGIAVVDDLVRRWNDAHTRRAASALAAVYAPKVWFYGVALDRAACVERKAASFAATPDYTQTVADVTAMDDGAGGYFVRMTKVATSHGATKRWPAYLYVDDGHIVAEGDDQRVPDPLGRACVTITPDDWFVPNGLVPARYRVSALDAVRETMRSQHLASLRARQPGHPVLKVSVVACAGDVNAAGERARSYALEISGARWLMMERWASVDATTNVLSWDATDGKHSEALR